MNISLIPDSQHASFNKLVGNQSDIGGNTSQFILEYDHNSIIQFVFNPDLPLPTIDIMDHNKLSHTVNCST